MNADVNRQPMSPADLRERAHKILKGTDRPTHPIKDASSALRVLFDLASSPATAHDALALLHELQVHQVELDLQNEELSNTRSELEAAWTRQVQLFDASPSAQLVLDSSGRLMACNAHAQHCFQQGLNQLLGKRLTHWLDPADHAQVQAWLVQTQQGGQPLSMALKLILDRAATLSVVASACANPLAPGALVAWVIAPATSA
jgi:PAS domain-containing protein